MKLGWVIFCAVAFAGFGAAFVWFFVSAMSFAIHPPDWEVYLRSSADPELRALTRGDDAIGFMLSCAPLGFALIWGARLWMAIQSYRGAR